jgi:exodeoxyribonuclease V alpha subunit
MSTLDRPEPRDERPLALADALQAWTLRKLPAAQELARALALAARAEADGHACVRLGADDGQACAIDALRRQPWVGDGTTITPAVLTASGDFFLWRNWRHEQRVGDALLRRIVGADSIDPALWQAAHAQLFAGMDAAASAGQRAAVAQALGKRLFVLSGGPGTGKTSTVLRLLLLQQQLAAARRQRPPTMALAAPTGKAAQRLSQAVRDGKAKLHAEVGEQPGWAAALAAIPEGAQTLHRLLGALPAEDAFRHGPGQPLPHDIVVVDEASMVDLAMMRALLDALAPTATLVLVGDPDQLVSVSAGSVLADIVAVADAGGNGFAGHAARLTHVWRAGSELAGMYAAARRGDGADLQEGLARIDACALHTVADPRALAAHTRRWLARPEWQELHAACRSDDDPAAAFDALRELQLLTALRSGPFGSEALNLAIDAHWRRGGGGQWYPGRAVLIRNNDYTRRLFNGDVGLAIGHGASLRVVFETVNADGQPGLRHLLPRELPDHDLASALTVHKSQGSEYGHVAVLLPPAADSRILSRQLLYTAISRARRSVEIWSSAESLSAALAQVSVRAGGLRQRLAAATPEEPRAPRDP